jgi:hypothetical protein
LQPTAQVFVPVLQPSLLRPFQPLLVLAFFALAHELVVFAHELLPLVVAPVFVHWKQQQQPGQEIASLS